MRISAVWYPVRKWAEARRFYEEALGLAATAASDDAGWAAYSTEGGPPFFLVRAPEQAGGAGGAVVTFACEDIDALRAPVVAAGGRVDPEVQEGPDARILTFYDPDGNRLEASERKA